ncbi:hypothetical protein [Pontimicrobium sp. IMCC45349]|uniref:hypothetical protein n=1 Tax=Pontimicrobium sp. IMCC45349 TaxID=3391574 RepID=UPI0039A3E779
MSVDESKIFLKKIDFTLDEWVYRGLLLGFDKDVLKELYLSTEHQVDTKFDAQYVHLFTDDENKLITDFLLMLNNLDGHKFENLKLAIEITLRKKKSKSLFQNLS